MLPPRSPLAEPVRRRILGIDPGTRITGWGLVELEGSRSRLVACGAIRTKGPDMDGRLLEIHTGLVRVLAESSPGVVALERPFLGKNPSAALAVGMARGVAVLAAAQAGLRVRELTPAMVKKAVVGNGNAAKEQVAAMVRVLLGVRDLPGPADVTDALAVALAATHRLALA